MEIPDNVKIVVNSISSLITSALRQAANEERHPGGCADSMDEIIKDGYERADALRRLRNDFEEIMAGTCRRRLVDFNPVDFLKKINPKDSFNLSNAPDGPL